VPERFTPSGLVTLTSDFGTRDGYVGAMKGVLATLAPDLRVVDVAHDVEPQDVAHGAAVLRTACLWFPPGTVHLAIVDPGVGTERAPIVVRGGRHVFVGPDNGIFDLVVEALGGVDDCRRIDLAGALATVLPKNPSTTFHGRDVFAPAAAAIATGRVAPEDVGPEHRARRLAFAGVREASGWVEGRVTHADRFGNVVTNLQTAHVRAVTGASGRCEAVLPDGRRLPVVRTYGDVAPGEPLALLGSDGFLEIAIREGSARETLALTSGIAIRVESV